ncbi:hypothetical protein Celaphus_00002112, partial [Cervus elaphus hippelaphus]
EVYHVFKIGRSLAGLDLVIIGINFQDAPETSHACTYRSFRILISFNQAHIVAVTGYIRVIFQESPLFCEGENLQIPRQQKPLGPQVKDAVLAFYLQEGPLLEARAAVRGVRSPPVHAPPNASSSFSGRCGWAHVEESKEGNSSPSDICQQAERLLYEHKLNDKTLQKAQLEQHKMFQNFPTIPALAIPSAPPPLVMDTKPKILWFHDVAQDLANSNAQAGTPENQITFKMLTGSGQFNSMEAQVQCPSLLHEQLKEVVLEAWDQITPQRKLTDNYTKISQRPNKAYANFLARLGVAISHNVVEKKAKMQLEKLLAYENTNQKYQRAIAPIHETGNIIDCLKFHELGDLTGKRLQGALSLPCSTDAQ